MKNWYKFECIECGRIPERGWIYMPSTGDNIDYFYCDECVPRGCSCNHELNDGIDYDSEEAKDPKNYHENLDRAGRKLPCCEYWFLDNEHTEKQRLPPLPQIMALRK